MFLIHECPYCGSKKLYIIKCEHKTNSYKLHCTKCSKCIQQIGIYDVFDYKPFHNVDIRVNEMDLYCNLAKKKKSDLWYLYNNCSKNNEEDY